MGKLNKYVCIHGHFYQPPRENAWLEVIEYQESAHPYHDWNERINAECYAPNCASRILDSSQLIINIVNNYAKISFNFGPTLLSWLEQKDPETYQSILEADRLSVAAFGGHGNAIAQVHSHSIMPLNNARDKETQIIWGLRDFEHRFGRKAEGIWLAETAVDTPTLELLASQNIAFTVLAPRQGKAIRKRGASDWIYLDHAAIDPRRPYLCKLPSGKSIALFFYDGLVAQDVAFSRLLNSGKSFANRLMNTMDYNTAEAQIAHIATDGESYGHHHRYGEMALADCLYTIENSNRAQLINYGLFLEKFPPQYEVMIHENSSWSCVHGVERWRSNCGCHTGGQAGWTQKWRAPLRGALDWLRDQLVAIFETQSEDLLTDAWEARNDFIGVILDRSNDSVNAFLKKNSKTTWDEAAKVQILRLLEMQRNALYMYTSCGWFFTEVSGIETTQILQYACRAIYYARQVANIDLEQGFIERLAKAPSNIPEHLNGAEIYKKYVLPAQIGLKRTGIHYAITSLFEQYPETLPIFNYIAESEDYERIQAGNQILAVGRASIRSRVTHSRKNFSFAVLYLGQQDIIGNISTSLSKESFAEMQTALRRAFSDSNLAEVIGVMQLFFGPKKYTISDLFKDDKIKILNRILVGNLGTIEVSLRDIYNDNYQLMNTFLKNNLPIGYEYQRIAQYVLNVDLQRFFSREVLYIKELRRIASEFKKWSLEISDKKQVEYVANQAIVRNLLTIQDKTNQTEAIEQINMVLDELEVMGINAKGWKAQNIFFAGEKARRSDKLVRDAAWLKAFIKLGKHLGVKVVV